jgi:Protein of unknown function (DUF4245)
MSAAHTVTTSHSRIRPRRLRCGQDIRVSIARMLLICIALFGALLGCSTQPKHPKPVPSPAPTIDAAAALRADAGALHFPIRVPNLPARWQATSAKRDTITAGRTLPPPDHGLGQAGVSTIEYLAPGGIRISLVQSDADERYLVEYVDTATMFEKALHKTGRQQVDGVTWVVYTGATHTQPVWTTRLSASAGPAQIAITGTAGTDEYRTLAAAVQTQPPLPAG